jgi:hypothetical protein
MVKTRRTLAVCAVLAFWGSLVLAEEKPHEHGGKGPHGGSIVEIGDKDDHHVEIVHDEKAGKLTAYFLLADQKTAFSVKDAPKLNLKTKDGNKQLEMKGADSKWEAADDVLKAEPNGRISLTLPDGKKYNVKIEEAPPEKK